MFNTSDSHSELGEITSKEKRAEERGLYPGTPGTLSDLLDYYEARRDQLIMDLRYIDKQLVRHGRLRRETLPRRCR